MTEDAVQKFYEKEAKVYDETRFRSSQGIYVDSIQKTTVLDLIGSCKGKHILEIGSGTGRFTRELVERGAHVTCIDLSKNMHTKSYRSITCSDSVNYFVMSGLDLGFADESFDGCFSVNTMSHIKNYSAVLAEVSRVLKNGGFFILNFPNMSGLYFPIGGFVNFFECSLQAPVYSRWYSMKTIFHSICGAGLTPVKVVGHMIFPKKYCPNTLFKCLKELDIKLAHSSLRYLSGDVFVKSYRV